MVAIAIVIVMGQTYLRIFFYLAYILFDNSLNSVDYLLILAL